MVDNKEILKILVTQKEIPEEAMKMLKSSHEVITCDILPQNREEILKKVKGVHAILWVGQALFNTEILDAAGTQLRAASVMTAGVDYVDVEEFKKRKIPLGRTPDVVNDAVADTAIGLMIAAARRFHEGREQIANCNWEKYNVNWMLGHEIRNATVGFYGFGGIGQAIAKRLFGFNIDRILYTTRRSVGTDIEKKYNATKVEFNELIAKSDIIFVAAPLTPETKGIFDSIAFNKMKDTAVLVNIARGDIINQSDLYTALKTRQIFAAGLDVMTPEPLPPNHQLLNLPNVVLVPHLGTATKRTRTDMAVIAAINIIRALDDEPMVASAY